MKTVQPKTHIKEELLALQENMTILAERLGQGELSTAGLAAAEKLLEIFTEIQNLFINNENDYRVDLIIPKLPLLYLQITKIN